MRRLSVVIFSAAMFFIAGVGTGNAQSCNPPSGWLQQNGQVQLGNVMVFGPNCGQVEDGGVGPSPPISAYASWPTNYISNGDFSVWTKCPSFTCALSTSSNFNISAGYYAIPDGYSMGAGYGGFVQFATGTFGNGQTDVLPPPIHYGNLFWITPPTLGSYTEYTATCGGLPGCRNSYIDVMPVNESHPGTFAGQTFTFSGYFRVNSGTIAITPIIFMSTGISGWLVGQPRLTNSDQYTTNTGSDGQFYVYQAMNNATTGLPVSAIANNGVGLCRVTVASTAVFTTGQPINVGGSIAGGVTGCEGTFTATVIDATRVDLQGTTFGGVYTTGAYAGRPPTHLSGTVSDGSVNWAFIGRGKGRVYDLYESNVNAASGTVSATSYLGTPHNGATCTIGTSWTYCAKTITFPQLGYVNSTDYAGSGDSPRTLLPLVDARNRGGAIYYASAAIDIIGSIPANLSFDFVNFRLEPGTTANPFVPEPPLLTAIQTMPFADRLGLTFGLTAPNTGLIAQTSLSPSNFARRSIVSSDANINVANGDGASGNPTIGTGGNISVLSGANTTGLYTITGVNSSSARRAIATSDANMSVSNADGVAGNPTINIGGNLSVLSGANTTGLYAITGVNSSSARRSIATAISGTSIANANGVAGDPTLQGTVGVPGGGTGGITAQAAMANLKGVYVLGASAVASSITGTTTETTLSTIAVPGNAMGANGVVRVTVQWGYSGGTGSWTPRIKFNGTAYSDPSAFGNTSLSGRTQTQWANRNATNSQVGMGVQQINWAGVGSAVTTSSHDTTASQNITLTCQLATATDTCTMHSYLIELMVP